MRTSECSANLARHQDLTIVRVHITTATDPFSVASEAPNWQLFARVDTSWSCPGTMVMTRPVTPVQVSRACRALQARITGQVASCWAGPFRVMVS